MIEVVGDLFDQEADAICLTTNGFVKANGEAVMGRGCAKQAADLWPELPGMLGSRIQKEGVRVTLLSEQVVGTPGGVLGRFRTPYHVVAFPVKPDRWMSTGSNVVSHLRSRFHRGAMVPGWALKALPSLIDQSAKQLRSLTEVMGWRRVVLPRPGCGAGELGWEEVRQILNRHLDDRFESITFGGNGRNGKSDGAAAVL
ncbi:MAG: hypothetical protein HYT87_12825 [Nitrospirae bacterium]|nr:hypothetical protein [Nitrospirota bacterium]